MQPGVQRSAGCCGAEARGNRGAALACQACMRSRHPCRRHASVHHISCFLHLPELRVHALHLCIRDHTAWILGYRGRSACSPSAWPGQRARGGTCGCGLLGALRDAELQAAAARARPLAAAGPLPGRRPAAAAARGPTPSAGSAAARACGQLGVSSPRHACRSALTQPQQHICYAMDREKSVQKPLQASDMQRIRRRASTAQPLQGLGGGSAPPRAAGWPRPAPARRPAGARRPAARRAARGSPAARPRAQGVRLDTHRHALVHIIALPLKAA